MLQPLQRYSSVLGIFAAPYVAAVWWYKFLNEYLFLFLVLDEKFDVAGKAASYAVAEVSKNYFYQEKLCQKYSWKLPQIWLTNRILQEKKPNRRTPNEIVWDLT